MIKADFSQVRKFEKALATYAAKGIPHAARTALNATAFEARKEWTGQLGKGMTLRNTWTTRSLQVDKARGTQMASMQSVVGSRAAYMGVRETGETKVKKGRVGVPIPSPVAAGQARGANRTKLVRRANRLPNIHLAKRPGRTPQQRNAIAIRQAAAGSKFAFLELGGKRVIARVTGSKRRIKVQTIWDLSRTSVRIKPIPTLAQTLEAIEPRLPPLYEKALIEQLKRAKIGGY